MRGIALAACLVILGALSGGAWADQRDERLAVLFERLKAPIAADEARAIEQQIWHIWTEDSDDESNALMRRGIVAMQQEENEQALAAFNAVVERRPGFAEGWNKRATLYFIMGDFDASVADIERTLALEPRHFGAFSGLGQIYLFLDKKQAALKAFEAALAIDPHLDSVRDAVESLKKALDGDPT